MTSLPAADDRLQAVDADSPLRASALTLAYRADQAHVIDGLSTVGSAWGTMDTVMDELARILLDPDLDVDVVRER